MNTFYTCKINDRMKQKDINKVAKMLLNAGHLPNHKRPIPSAKDLKRRFVLRLDRRGKPVLREVK